MEHKEYYENKTILITGGAGSIGGALTKHLLEYHPKSVRVFDNNETALYNLGQELNSNCIKLVLGDVRDDTCLRRACRDVDILFHAAALKHVPICEFNPFDAVKTNILGTQNVLDAALEENIEKVIFISTDKAVNPTNVMGTTKLLAERLTISANYYKGEKKTVFSCVRFGNVMDSRGSVIPLFKNQIQFGGPVTITDPRMSRFIMSIPKAIKLILDAGANALGGEIFILKMPAIHIQDLADVMVEEFAPVFKIEANTIRYQTIGIRPGEKLFEELINQQEKNVYENDEIFVIFPKKVDCRDHINLNKIHLTKNEDNKGYSSNTMGTLSKKQIRSLIKDLIS